MPPEVQSLDGWKNVLSSKYSVLQGIALFVFHAQWVHLAVVIIVIIDCISSSECFSNVS